MYIQIIQMNSVLLYVLPAESIPLREVLEDSVFALTSCLITAK